MLERERDWIPLWEVDLRERAGQQSFELVICIEIVNSSVKGWTWEKKERVMGERSESWIVGWEIGDAWGRGREAWVVQGKLEECGWGWGR